MIKNLRDSAEKKQYTVYQISIFLVKNYSKKVREFYIKKKQKKKNSPALTPVASGREFNSVKAKRIEHWKDF